MEWINSFFTFLRNSTWQINRCRSTLIHSFEEVFLFCHALEGLHNQSLWRGKVSSEQACWCVYRQSSCHAWCWWLIPSGSYVIIYLHRCWSNFESLSSCVTLRINTPRYTILRYAGIRREICPRECWNCMWAWHFCVQGKNTFFTMKTRVAQNGLLSRRIWNIAITEHKVAGKGVYLIY